jgi:hypothetical protein
MKYLIILVCIVWLFFLMPTISHAHQPRIPEGNTIAVVDPEISKAYYTTLSWEADTYTISSAKPFALYINILIPYADNQAKNLSFTLLDKNTWESRVFDGTSYTWTTFFEPFGYDTYLKWPEYKSTMPAGEYTITVTSPSNQNIYALAIWEAEVFDLKETINALTLIPKIKREFFWYSPISFILSPLGRGYIVIMVISSFIFWFLYRWLLRLFAASSPIRYNKNIGTSGRWMRAITWAVLLIIAITTSWSPFLLFFSWFCFFESFFSRCWLNAALGKSSCPL